MFQHEVPATCARCGGDKWVSVSIGDQPKVPYDLNVNDRRLLHQLRIDPESEPA